MSPLIRPTDHGLYCEAGDFFVDPWRPVDRAVVTHAHSDHACWGCGSYLSAKTGEGVLRERVGKEAKIESLPYGHNINQNGVAVAFYPAGHILGSAQVRIEHRGEVWVVSGDYKTTPDPSCDAFEPVPCDTFITESTFGLPIYRWPDPENVLAQIHDWWRHNRERGVTSVIYAYPLGKSQRVLHGLDASVGPIGVHASIAKFVPHYEASGRPMPPHVHLNESTAPKIKGKGLVIVPAMIQQAKILRKLEPISQAACSGWMRVRGSRRFDAFDRGFVLSDHADWPGLHEAIKATGARNIGVTHGQITPMVRWLNENGWNAFEVPTRFTDTENPESETEDSEAENERSSGD